MDPSHQRAGLWCARSWSKPNPTRQTQLRGTGQRGQSRPKAIPVEFLFLALRGISPATSAAPYAGRWRPRAGWRASEVYCDRSQKCRQRSRAFWVKVRGTAKGGDEEDTKRDEGKRREDGRRRGDATGDKLAARGRRRNLKPNI